MMRRMLSDDRGLSRLEWLGVGTVVLCLAVFVPQFRGSRLDGPPLDQAQITSMGLMIYDKQDGPFELRMASVHAYAAQTTAAN